MDKPYLLHLSITDALAVRDALTYAILSDYHISEPEAPDEERYEDTAQLEAWHQLAATLDGIIAAAPIPGFASRDEFRAFIASHKDRKPRPQG